MRIFRGEKFWQAHHQHFYQRMIGSGWSHRRLALWAYLLMVACGGTALSMRESESTPTTMVLLAWVLVYAGLLHFVQRRWQRHRVNCQ